MTEQWSFAAFVAARGDGLWALAYLLVADGQRVGGARAADWVGADRSDEHRAEEHRAEERRAEERRAEELVELALSRARPRWTELERLGAAETEVRRELIASWLAGPAAPSWAGPTRTMPDRVGSVDAVGSGAGAGDDPREALTLLAALSPLPRAAVALRALAVPPWDAADALSLSTAELTAVEADASAVMGRSSPRYAQLLHRLRDAVPAPPYALGRTERVERRAARARRQRHALAVGATALVVGLVAVPVLASGDEPTAAPASVPPPPVAERLVDPLPIPQSCEQIGGRAQPPAYPYESDGADAVWFRFCPPPGVDAIRFAPDITVTSLAEIDDLVDGWVRSDGAGSPTCDYSAFADRATIRAHVGTLDGALHIVDMEIGTCGAVTVNGQTVGVDGRAAFAATVALLGDELAEPVEAPRTLPATPAFCPRTLGQVPALSQTTVREYPRVPGLVLPLPATAGLICSYAPGGQQPGVGAGSGTRGRLLEPADAELVRAAYLARSPGTAGCADGADRADRTRYGVILTDLTGSRRVFTLDPGRCGLVTGPAGVRGAAGPWLSDAMTVGAGTALLDPPA